MPIRSVTWLPIRVPSAPANGPAIIIATDDGTKNRPTSIGVAPNP